MADTVTVFTADGTHNLFDWAGGAVIAIPDNFLLGTSGGVGPILPPLLNPSLCTQQVITWPDAVLPMGASMVTGKNTLSAAITAIGDAPFILVGYSQGAGICALVYDQIVGMDNWLGTVTFGNITRQAGHTNPMQTDPGGEGCWSTNLMTGTIDSRWWDFALPLDAACTVPNATVFGVDVQTAFDLVIGSFSGGDFLEFFVAQFEGLVTAGLALDIQAIEQLALFGLGLVDPGMVGPGMISLGPHGNYWNTAPPGAPAVTGSVTVNGGNIPSNACSQLAANRINELAAAALSGGS
jgi:hypothetical protein